ncbi:MAG: hypothetical protein WA061_02090 [Microgenomates group bacterium]
MSKMIEYEFDNYMEFQIELKAAIRDNCYAGQRRNGRLWILQIYS